MITIIRDPSPTDSAQIDKCIAVLIGGPHSLDDYVVQPHRFKYRFSGPHLAINTTFSIFNTKETVLPPTTSPTIFGNPILPTIVISHDADAMSTSAIAGHMMIHAGSIGKEIIIYRETC